MLIEAAWHYGPRPHIGPVLQARQAGQPEHVLAISNKAQRRLHRVYQAMKARGKPHGVVTVAVARETELLSLGCRDRRLTPADIPTFGRAGRRAVNAAGHARFSYEQQPQRLSRSLLDPRITRQRTRISDWRRRQRARRPALPNNPKPRAHGRINHAQLTNATPYQLSFLTTLFCW